MYLKWKRMRAVLKSLKKGSSYHAACEAAKISRMTLWLWRKDDERFDRLVQKAWDSRVENVEDAHYALAMRGNWQAQQFFLTNRLKHRWYKDPDTVIHNNNQTKQLIVVTPQAIQFSSVPQVQEITQAEGAK